MVGDSLTRGVGRLAAVMLLVVAMFAAVPVFAGPAEEIADATVAATYLAGELVFASDRPAGSR